MKKILSAIGKKNIIIISGILLIGIAIYLDLTLKFDNPDAGAGNSYNSYIMENDYGYDYDYEDDDSKVFGQAALVNNNMGFDEDMGAGAGGSGNADMDAADIKNIPENYFAHGNLIW